MHAMIAYVSPDAPDEEHKLKDPGYNVPIVRNMENAQQTGIIWQHFYWKDVLHTEINRLATADYFTQRRSERRCYSAHTLLHMPASVPTMIAEHSAF